jgi:glutamate racemase
MVGVFDSGAGGLTAISELRRIMPSVDVCFFADRKNAPYGTKSQAELICLAERDILKLYNAGCERILMACCTASTVFPLLPKPMQNIACQIISPTAKEAARVTKNGNIGVIATEATVASGAFRRELTALGSVREVIELPTQKLVTLIECGVTDKCIKESEITKLSKILEPIKNSDIDTLILGCTHFPHLEKEIGKLLPGIQLVSSSREGAKEISKYILPHGTGRTVYL